MGEIASIIMAMIETPSWSRLSELAATACEINISSLIDKPRLDRYSLTVDQLYADFSKHLVTDEILESLTTLAVDTDVIGKAVSMRAGQKINVTENRAVLHTALRSPESAPSDFVNHAQSQNERMGEMSDAIRQGKWRGQTDKLFTDVINIGIGGSDLGPKMVCEALREFADGPNVHFISNVDGAEILSLLKQLNAESTLFVICSKTFTTAETMLNASTAMKWLSDQLGIDEPASSKHCIAITASPDTAGDFGVPDRQILTFDETVGGRYSLWSTLGFSISLAAGQEHFQALLDGAAVMDDHFTTAPPEENLPLTLALLGIWYNNFLGAQSQAVIPYCERLSLFVDYLQQMDMESNGKSTSVTDTTVDYETGPIIWGQTGTNGQHAFFQLLHQGTKLVPIDFIGTVTDRLSNPEHHRMLNANMIAQAEALMLGRSSDDPHRHYAGNRPSTVLLLDELTPKTLGMLIALYEHKVFCQGVIWSINSFDQWGVELGKVLTNGILEGSTDHDASTNRLLKKTGLNR